MMTLIYTATTERSLSNPLTYKFHLRVYAVSKNTPTFLCDVYYIDSEIKHELNIRNKVAQMFPKIKVSRIHHVS